MSEPDRQQTIESWSEMLSAENTAGTIKHYTSWADRFEDWREWSGQPPNGRDAIANFDEFLRDEDAIEELRADVGEHSRWNYSKPRSGTYQYGTRIKAASAVKGWLDFAYEIEFPKRRLNNIQFIVEGEAPPFDPEIAEQETVREIFEETEDCVADSCHAMTMVGYDAILRCCELTRLKWDDYNPDNHRLYVNAVKGSKNRWIELSPKAVGVLEEYREMVKERFDDPQWLFYTFYQYNWNKPWTKGAWSQHFLKRHWDAGFHAFARHSAISNRLAAGQSLTEVSQRARHKKLSTTQQYIQFASNSSVVPPELE